MTALHWLLLYFALGAAYSAWAWHVRGEARFVKASNTALQLGVPRQAVAALGLAMILVFHLPLWPLNASQDVLAAARRCRGTGTEES